MEKKILLIFGFVIAMFGVIAFSSQNYFENVICAQDNQVYFGQRECVTSAPSYCPSGYQQENGTNLSFGTQLCVDFSPRYCEIMTGSSEVVVINNFYYCARQPLESVGSCIRGSGFRKFDLNLPASEQVSGLLDSLSNINESNDANLIRTTEIELGKGLTQEELNEIGDVTGLDDDLQNIDSFICRDTSRFGSADMKLMIPIVTQFSRDTGIDGYNRDRDSILLFENDVLANGFIFNRQQRSPTRTGYCDPGQLYIGQSSANEACYDTRTAFPTSYCRISNPPVEDAEINGSNISEICIRSNSNETSYIFSRRINRDLQSNVKKYILSNRDGEIISGFPNSNESNSETVLRNGIDILNNFDSCGDIFNSTLNPDSGNIRLSEYNDVPANEITPSINSPSYNAVKYNTNSSLSMIEFYSGLIEEDFQEILDSGNDDNCTENFKKLAIELDDKCSTIRPLNIFEESGNNIGQFDDVLTCNVLDFEESLDSNNENISTVDETDLFETTRNQAFCRQTSSELLDRFSNKGCSRLAVFNSENNTISPGGNDFNSCVECLYSDITISTNNLSVDIVSGVESSNETILNTMIDQNYTYLKQDLGVSVIGEDGQPLSVQQIQNIFAGGDIAEIIKQRPDLEPFITPRLGFTYTDLGCINSSNTASVINTIVRIVLFLASGIVVVRIIQGAITMQQGNAEGFQEGQSIVVSAIVGLLVIIFSIVLLNFVGINVLGFGSENGGFFSEIGG